MTPNTIGSIALAGCLLLLAYIGPELAGAQTSRARLEGEAQYTEGGNERCLECHGGEAMTIIADTPHGNLDNPHSPYSQQGCESCHGPGSVHVSRAGGGVGFPLLLSFKSMDNVPEQNAVCLDCHVQTLGELEGIAWTDSLHDGAGLSCQDCHASHSAERSMHDRDLQRAGCASCHRRGLRRHPRFEDQEIEFDEMACSTCHDVH